MYKYVMRRLLLAVPVLLLSSLIVFSLMRVMPGDALIALMGEKTIRSWPSSARTSASTARTTSSTRSGSGR